jgi:hypothetical protein
MMAPTDEVIAVAEVVRNAAELYVTHMRDEADNALVSIEKTLRIGRRRMRTWLICHHKCSMGPENYGRSVETLPRIDSATDKQRADFDVYPYAAGSTVLMPERLRPDVPVQSPGLCHTQNAPGACWTTSRVTGAPNCGMRPNVFCRPVRSSSKWTSRTYSVYWPIGLQ